MQEKQVFASKYNCPQAVYSKPHITIALFMQHALNEIRIIHRFQQIIHRHTCFKVELQNFGSFPSHTIFINVIAKQKIVELAKALRETSKLLTLDKEKKPFFITEPHLTVARKLSAGQYESAWLEYEHKNFQGMFMANELLLLKRKQGDKKYLITKKFSLSATVTDSMVQGRMFA